jgi:hypothetical protein
MKRLERRKPSSRAVLSVTGAGRRCPGFLAPGVRHVVANPDGGDETGVTAAHLLVSVYRPGLIGRQHEGNPSWAS